MPQSPLLLTASQKMSLSMIAHSLQANETWSYLTLRLTSRFIHPKVLLRPFITGSHMLSPALLLNLLKKRKIDQVLGSALCQILGAVLDR